jgi:hypothetical protein
LGEHHADAYHSGARTHDITLSLDDPKPLTPDVAEWLRSNGIGGQPQTPAITDADASHAN